MSKKLWKFISLRKFLFILGEAVLIYASVIIASNLLWNIPYYHLFTIHAFIKVCLITAIFMISFYINDLYEVKTTDTPVEVARRIGQSFGMSCICLAFIYWFVPKMILRHGIVITSLIVMALFILLWRTFYQVFINKKILTEKTVLVGTGSLAFDIEKEIISRNELTYDIAGIAVESETSPIPESLQSTKVKYGFDNLAKFAMELEATTIIVSMDERRGRLPINELLECKMNELDVIDGIEFYENISGKLIVERINPSWLIFADGFKTSLFTRATKRVIDIVCSLFGLIVASPFMLVTGIIVKLESPGPMLFSQERSGRYRKPFILYKFRSMRADAEEKSGPVWAKKEDPRVTRFGKFIRKTRLDELPQLWNVLRGDMSLVGPRPEREFFVEKLAKEIPYYTERFYVRPGLTGWAQIMYSYGATTDDAAEKLRYELFYIKNVSIMMDILVILGTIKTVLLRRGAQ